VGEVFDEEKKLYFFEVVELAQRTIDFLHQASKDLEDQIDLGQPKD
jgi:peptide subunit release factor 1 (eRF1)